MIFTKKNYKISSGKNPSLFATHENELELYIFDNSVFKINLTFSNTLSCKTSSKAYPYNHICKINNDFLCVCFDDNISVINEKN